MGCTIERGFLKYTLLKAYFILTSYLFIHTYPSRPKTKVFQWRKQNLKTLTNQNGTQKYDHLSAIKKGKKRPRKYISTN